MRERSLSHTPGHRIKKYNSDNQEREGIILENRHEIHVPHQWDSLFGSYLEKGGILMVLGGVDTGKSTLVKWIADSLVRGGKLPAIVDCDMGQSDVGPPSTVGMTLIRKTFDSFTEVSADEIYFTGGFSPGSRILQSLTGAFRLVKSAVDKAAAHIIVNTTGWIDGGAVLYKQSKIDALNPSFIAALERDRELSSIIIPYKKMESMRICFLPVSPEVKERDRETRRLAREERMAGYFADARLLAFSTNRVGVSGISFPLIEEKIKDFLIALIDSRGRHRALGKVKAYSGKTRLLEVVSPYNDNPAFIRRLHFEDLKI